MKTAFFQQKNIEVYRTAQNSTEAAIDMLYLCNGNEASGPERKHSFDGGR